MISVTLIGWVDLNVESLGTSIRTGMESLGTLLGIEDLLTIVRFPLGLVLEITPYNGVLGTCIVRDYVHIIILKNRYLWRDLVVPFRPFAFPIQCFAVDVARFAFPNCRFSVASF